MNKYILLLNFIFIFIALIAYFNNKYKLKTSKNENRQMLYCPIM